LPTANELPGEKQEDALGSRWFLKVVLIMRLVTGDLGVTGGTPQRLSPSIAGIVAFAQGVPPRRGLSKRNSLKKVELWNGLLSKH